MFRPDPSSKAAAAAIELAKAKLAVDRLSQQGPKKILIPSYVDVKKHREAALRQSTDAQTFEESEPLVRNPIVSLGLADRSGVHVLPLGRVEWEKDGIFLPKGEPTTTPVLCVLVATGTLPLGDVKGFKVRGEFKDKAGRLVDFDAESSWAAPKNGVFVLTMPAGEALKGAAQFEGFEFRLIQVVALK